MNQKDIFAALQTNYTSDCTIKDFAAKLAKLFPLIKQLKNLAGYAVNVSGNIGNVELVNALPVLDRDNYADHWQYKQAETKQENLRSLYGQYSDWQKVTFSHDGGSYSFHIPIDCKFYSLFMAAIGANVASEVQEIEVLKTIEIPSVVLDKIGKAVNYVGQPQYCENKVFNNVAICIEGETCEIVATDAHKLYRSEQLKISDNGQRCEYLIPATDAKKIGKIKTKEKTVLFEILAGDMVGIAGYTCKLFTDAAFLNYRVVIPEYKSKMAFNRERMIEGVNKVLPSSNKYTSQIIFHLNGNISLKTCDVDFGFEANDNFPYETKDFPDTDIAFNGKFLLTVLNTYKKADKLEMLSEGNQHRPGIFTDGKDISLLMPMMLRGSY